MMRIYGVRIPWRGLRSCGDDYCDRFQLTWAWVRIPWRGLRSCGALYQEHSHDRRAVLRQNPLAGIEVMWGNKANLSALAVIMFVRIPWRGLRSCGA